ncbi:flagellar protein FlgN [Specibacter cremeus]|uniref:flagellar protein FlgN n=1 Tax=Specibacter cremeus TaxID=1629051 RepID=UPI000F77ED6B|nr:flagellar protein FlgN [Specibacter cremeus]
MGPQELTNLLWREREMLDLLIFKLEEESLILTSGQTRWLDHAAREVEQVTLRLRDATLQRSVAAAAVATAWGLADDAGLPELAAAAPEGPWQEILIDHHRALTAQVAEAGGLRDTNLQFLRGGLRSTQDTLATLVPEAGTYDHTGHTSQEGASRFLDRSV